MVCEEKPQVPEEPQQTPSEEPQETPPKESEETPAEAEESQFIWGGSQVSSLAPSCCYKRDNKQGLLLGSFCLTQPSL